MLPIFCPRDPHDLWIGRTSKSPFSKKVWIPVFARTAHTYVVGKTGKGKSKFLLHCILEDISKGHGVGVIDPHSDLVSDILTLMQSRGILDDPQQRERLMVINPADTSVTIPFNVLATPGDPYEVAQGIIEAFKRAWSGTLSAAPNFENIMENSLMLLIKAKRTLVDLPRLFQQGTTFRDELLTEVNDLDLTSFFLDRVDEWGKGSGAERKESTLNKVSALTLNPHLKRMLGQQVNRLNFRNIMDEGKVLLVDLGQCGEKSQMLIGNLITTGIEQAAFSRFDIPTGQRQPFYLYIDEFQDFSATDGAVKTFSKILSGARKYGLHLTLAHQNLSQLTERMKGSVFGNVWTKIIFGVSEYDAKEIAEVVGLGYVDPTAIKHDAQTDTQHPQYSPLQEQSYALATQLANQKPREAFVRDYCGKNTQIYTIEI